MVTTCTELVHFAYVGELHVDTIRILAGVRGSRRLHFQVALHRVVTDDEAGQLEAEVALITMK